MSLKWLRPCISGELGTVSVVNEVHVSSYRPRRAKTHPDLLQRISRSRGSTCSRYSVYLLYWYKSTSTDAAAGNTQGAARCDGSWAPFCWCLLRCPHTAIYVSSYCYICVLILLYMCPHTSVYVSSYYSYGGWAPFCWCLLRCSHTTILILVYMCPHTTIYVSSCYCKCVLNICVLILLLRQLGPFLLVSPQVFLYCYICVLFVVAS